LTRGGEPPPAPDTIRTETRPSQVGGFRAPYATQNGRILNHAEGFVLDVLVQSRRDKKAAKRLLCKLLKKQRRVPRVLITDKLKSYAVAKREIMPGVEHRQHKGLNNRAENSHQPTRRRERIMKCFKSPRQVQRFLSTHDQVANVFSRRSNQDTATKFRTTRSQAFTTWAEVTGAAMAA